MAKQTVNVGASPNDNSGDSIRVAFQKINANFTELYTQLGLDELPLNLGAFEFTGSTISTTDSSAVTIDQATTVTSDLTVGGDIVPSVANGGDLGSLAKPWRSLYVSSSTVYFGGVPVSLDENNNLLVDGVAIADAGTAAWANITGKPTFAEVATSGSYTDLSNTPAIPTAVSQLANDSGFITAADIAGGTLTVDVNNTGDLKGSVFADDSTLLVDAVNATIPWSVISGTPSIPADIGDLTDTGNLLGAGSADSLTNNDDINITINNDDSSTYTWNFGQTGDLIAPGDIKTGLLDIGGRFVQDCADGTTSMRWINVEEGSSTTQILRVYTGETGDERIERAQLLLNWSGESDEYSGFTIKSFDNTDPENETEHDWVFQGDGSLIAPGTITAAAIQTDSITIGVGGTVNGQGATLGNFASVGTDEINSENDINIRVNLTDSTQRVWRFGEDGDLEAPGEITASAYRTSGNNISVGQQAGVTNQGAFGVAIGHSAGLSNQGVSAVALGSNAGGQSQGANTVAVGVNSGYTSQGINAVAVGNGAGYDNQETAAIAIGQSAGEQSQSEYAVAIGYQAGQTGQDDEAVAIGYLAGQTNQNSNAVAIGSLAGQTSQGFDAVSIGYQAGEESQGDRAVAIGYQAGEESQSQNAVAIGYQAGEITQGDSAVAIGYEAGNRSQGDYAVGIGYKAGEIDQAINSIVINATGSAVNNTTADSFVVKPVRNAAGTSILQYDSSTGEITHTNEIYSDQQVSITVAGEDSTQKTWYFGNDGNTDFPGTIDSPSIITQGIRGNEGTAEGNGNSLLVAAGSGSLSGGNLAIQAGIANSGTGGNIAVLAGTSQSGAGGNLSVSAGFAFNGQGGDVTISGGVAAGSAGSGRGGDTFIYGGTGGSAGDGGDIQIIAGSSSSYNGGTVVISSGSSSNQGGDLTLLGGAGSGGVGGDLIIEAGLGLSDPGDVIIRGGVGGEYRGDLIVEAGHVVIGSEGDINININLSDSTQRTWRFGEDGVLNVPGTIQLSSGALRFPNSTQQTTAYIADNVVQVSTTGGFTDDAITYNLGVYQFKMTSGHLQMRLIAPAGIVQNALVSTVENINEIISANNTGLLTLSDSTWTTVTGKPTAAGGDTIVATVVSTQEGKMYRVTAFRSFVSSSHMVSRETLRG